MSLRIGIDVGGTNTDAAVLDGDVVVAATKATTTEDVTTGILDALTDVLPAIDVAEVEAVFIGTTHFINAIAQAKGLATVAAVRIATPPQSLLPMIDWPEHLLPVIGDNFHVVRGGSQFDGRLLNDLDEEGLREVAGRIRAAGIRHVALSAVFSSVNAAPEIRAAEILEEELPEATVTRSALVGRVGLLERENATILNAALRDLADQVINGLERVVGSVGISAPILLSQNDGTVMTLERARLFPIFTIASGPTNSMRGAALLAGITDGVVIDVGGTTSDIGMLQHGFPRESTIAMSLAGVRSNFRIPDVLSLALGGGTIISDDGAKVGPESVGYRIGTEALVFGGGTTTFTDIGVAGGADPIGDPARVAGLDPALVERGLGVIRDMLVTAVDKAKLSSGEVPVIAVGGGAALLKAVGGIDGIVIPPHAGVANAVGASYAEAGGEVDSVYALEGKTRAGVLEEAKELAVARAVEAGADPERVRIIEAEEVPLTHLPGGTAVHARVKAVGPFRALKTAEGK